jgi:16S rRNA (adenine1518-N6/adenine1519-N6)-dimethyltransferase
MQKKKTEKKSSIEKFFISNESYPKKHLGQNFMRDSHVLGRMAEIAALSKEDEVLEIGAGFGALTLFLGQKAGRVLAIEKDKRFIDKLKETVSHLKNVEIVEGDALRAEFERFCGEKRIKVVANLPYSISSPILIKLLEERELFSLLVLMIQREVAERIVALPGSRIYGSLSVVIQTYMEASIELLVPPEAFWPRPLVDSAVIKLVPLSTPRISIRDDELFRSIVRAAFSSRRKVLSNSLSSLFPKPKSQQILESSEIDGKRRAETLSIEEFGRLAREASKIEGLLPE